MKPVNGAPEAASAARPAGLWPAFAQRHLFDYHRSATALWLALAGCGALTALWALHQVLALDWRALAQVQMGLMLVVAAAFFPVHIPGTKYSVGVADVFIYALLALHGAPAAALAAGAEGLVGAWRSSQRLTSRVSTPAVATCAMALSGSSYEWLHARLVHGGWPEATATLAAVCAVALPQFALGSLPLLGLVALKNRRRLSLWDWARDYSWMGSMALGAASVAGVLVMNARQFGPAVIVVATVVVAVAMALAHLSLNHHEAQRALQAQRLAEARLAAELNQRRFTAAFTHAAIGIAIARPDGTMLQVNPALCQLLGQDEATLLGQPFAAQLHPGDAALFQRRQLALPGATPEPFSMELRCRSADGTPRWVSLHCGHFTDPADERAALIYQLHDITSRRLAEDELHHTAYHDSLTDLANRKCFNEQLALAVEASRTDESRRFAVLFLDLDRFKTVNDSLGHIAGNALLREVARRLVDGVRPGDLVARLGGDEFAILLHQVGDGADALALAERLLTALAAPLQLCGTEVQPGASIGLTLSDLGYRSTDEVLRDADLAMYAAKAGGRHRVAMFDQGMHQRAAERLVLEADLRHAIGDGQLTVVYQPLYDLEPYRLSGFEALARWVHPERGPISPAVFIGLAEESGHIEALTAWVIDQAVAQLATWQAQWPALAQADMHVNISGRDLANPALAPQVREVLQRHGLAARCLTLEITETTLMGRLDTALDTLHSLRKAGVRFSIDDFGTGYSSLAYLSTLPIDSLKIDRSFVMGMAEQPQNVEIVRAMLMLGRSLGKKVIAEGIETVAQLATLKDLGVDVGQGYLLSRPLRPEQVDALVARAVAEPA